MAFGPTCLFVLYGIGALSVSACGFIDIQALPINVDSAPDGGSDEDGASDRDTQTDTGSAYENSTDAFDSSELGSDSDFDTDTDTDTDGDVDTDTDMDTDTESVGDTETGTESDSDSCALPLDWWYPAWSSRIPLTIEEAISGSLTAGYSVVVRVDTASGVAAGNMLESGDDIRVIWQDEDTPVELARHLIGMNTDATEIWFKTQADITTADSRYSLYFDNPDADAPPGHWSDSMGNDTPSAVYLAADDFEEEDVDIPPDGWEGSGNYRVALDGTNKVLEGNSASPNADYLFAGDYGWGDIVLSARIRIVDTSGEHYGLFLRAQPGTDFYTTYYGTSTNDATLQFWEMTIETPDATGLSSSNLIDSVDLGSNLGTLWHDLEVRMLGGDLRFFYDGGIEAFGYTVSDAYPQGRIGLCVGYNAGVVRWDNLRVRAYVSPEPTVSSGLVESIPCS